MSPVEASEDLFGSRNWRDLDLLPQERHLVFLLYELNDPRVQNEGRSVYKEIALRLDLRSQHFQKLR